MMLVFPRLNPPPLEKHPSSCICTSGGLSPSTNVSCVSIRPHRIYVLFQAVSRMGGLWRKQHVVWVNVGGLHAGVYLLKRTTGVFGQTAEDVYESRGAPSARPEEREGGEGGPDRH